MVLHPLSATRIPSAAIREVRARVFRLRDTTLAEQAERFSFDNLEATLLGMRRDMRAALESLPDAAYAAQAADDTPVWSSGEIVAHVYYAQTDEFLRAARVVGGLPAGVEAPGPDADGAYPLLSRAETLAALDAADADLRDVLDLLRGADIDRRATDAAFGDVTPREMLLFFAIHEDDHLGQLEELVTRST